MKLPSYCRTGIYQNEHEPHFAKPEALLAALFGAYLSSAQPGYLEGRFTTLSWILDDEIFPEDYKMWKLANEMANTASDSGLNLKNRIDALCEVEPKLRKPLEAQNFDVVPQLKAGTRRF